MNRRKLIRNMGLSAGAALLGRKVNAMQYLGATLGNPSAATPGQPAPAPAGPFAPTWDSLAAYTVPQWFREAKFGMWAHWGPQCQPEAGDWYARNMYIEGSEQYKIHLQKYGHPSVFGFKDVIHTWKAERWDPQALVALYKRAGAKYFMALANHHDNFDLYNSKYQPWNSVAIGPRKDLIAGWAKAAKEQDLPFGVSVHAAHAWTFYETAQRHDLSGPYKDIPYDGKLRTADGHGKWWNGLDPQALYAQDHALSQDSWKDGLFRQWGWGNGASIPSKAYDEKFYKRTLELIDRYNPDLVYFDDSQLPLWPVSDAGLRIAAHVYNKSIREKGSLQAVVTGKILDEQQRKCLVWDIERGQANAIQPLPWQTDTCIGNWHYDRALYEQNGYKPASTVIQMLVDIVSKNGNLMLNIPVRGDGTIDEKERAIVEAIGDWMHLNGESIYGTRPWEIFGEGPALDHAAALSGPGFNEGKGAALTAQDWRFATKDDVLYATCFDWPQDATVTIRSLAENSTHRPGEIHNVRLLATGEPLTFHRTTEGLKVILPEKRPATTFANVISIS
jgi:alpha-L-fucosidase